MASARESVERIHALCRDPRNDSCDLEPCLDRLVGACPGCRRDYLAVAEPAHLPGSQHSAQLGSQGNLRRKAVASKRVAGTRRLSRDPPMADRPRLCRVRSTWLGAFETACVADRLRCDANRGSTVVAHRPDGVAIRGAGTRHLIQI